jgi:hypothetical protein
MTKQQYVDTLITLCRLTNLADAVDHPDHAAWMSADYSRTHCNVYYDLLKTILNADQMQDFINGESVTI